MKKCYEIASVIGKPEWEKISPAEADEYVWGGDYTPHTEARAAVSNGNTLCIKMTCREKNPQAKFFKHNDPVCKDSCMEFFVGFEFGGKYLNFEVNSIGTSLCAIGSGRHERIYVSSFAEVPAINAVITDNEWSWEASFTIDFLREVFGNDISLESGTVLYANFYKCGDETAAEHYGMWNPVGTETPDFHRPEYFGELKVM